MVNPIEETRHANKILIFLLENGQSKKTDLLKVLSSSDSLSKALRELEDSELIQSSIKLLGRKIIYINLTEKGRLVAKEIKKAADIAEEKNNTEIALSTSDYAEFQKNVSNYSVLSHFNVLDDHIAIREYNFDKKGHDRVVFVYVRVNGNGIMRLWCEADNSFDCWHVKYAWTLPDVQAMVQYQILKGNAKGVD